MAHKGAYLSLHEMKQPAVLLLPLGEGFFKHYLHYCIERGAVRVMCLAQELSKMTWLS